MYGSGYTVYNCTWILGSSSQKPLKLSFINLPALFSIFLFLEGRRRKEEEEGKTEDEAYCQVTSEAFLFGSLIRAWGFGWQCRLPHSKRVSGP